MFDVFDVIVSEIADGRIRMVRDYSAFGERDDSRVTWSDVPVARPTEPEPSREICGVRESWATYSSSEEARAAAEDDERWSRFLAALEGWLSATSDWRVLIESDCGQYPLERVSMASKELVDRLDGHRRAPTSSFALLVSKR